MQIERFVAVGFVDRSVKCRSCKVLIQSGEPRWFDWLNDKPATNPTCRNCALKIVNESGAMIDSDFRTIARFNRQARRLEVEEICRSCKYVIPEGLGRYTDLLAGAESPVCIHCVLQTPHGHKTQIKQSEANLVQTQDLLAVRVAKLEKEIKQLKRGAK